MSESIQKMLGVVVTIVIVLAVLWGLGSQLTKKQTEDIRLDVSSEINKITQ